MFKRSIAFLVLEKVNDNEPKELGSISVDITVDIPGVTADNHESMLSAFVHTALNAYSVGKEAGDRLAHEQERIEREEAAEILWDSIRDIDGWVPWVRHGNSEMQDAVRHVARYGYAPAWAPEWFTARFPFPPAAGAPVVDFPGRSGPTAEPSAEPPAEPSAAAEPSAEPTAGPTAEPAGGPSAELSASNVAYPAFGGKSHGLMPIDGESAEQRQARHDAEITRQRGYNDASNRIVPQSVDSYYTLGYNKALGEIRRFESGVSDASRGYPRSQTDEHYIRGYTSVTPG